MTQAEAIDIARNHASEQGWPWKQPVRCKGHGGWFKARCWEVRSNSDARGCNVVVVIDEATKAVTNANFLPR